MGNDDQDLLNRLNALRKTPTSIELNHAQHFNSPVNSQKISREDDLSSRLRSLRNASQSPKAGQELQPQREIRAGSAPPGITQNSSSSVKPHALSATPSVSASNPSLLGTPSGLRAAKQAPLGGEEEEKDPLRFDQTDIDDQELEDLLADLAPEEQWKLEPDEPTEIKKLLDEARRTIHNAENVKGSSIENAVNKVRTGHLTEDTSQSSSKTGNPLAVGHDLSVFAEDIPSRQRDDDDDGVAQDIVERALDETAEERRLEEEKKSEPNANRSASNDADDDEDSGGDDAETSFSLPSVPSEKPTTTKVQTLDKDSSKGGPPPRSKQSREFEDAITARMAALRTTGDAKDDGFNLPSVPSAAPGAQKKTAAAISPAGESTGGTSGIGRPPNYSDADIDSWCVICQDDATVECAGCDGDLYCANCWKEGHMGPDAGWEERRHRWTTYRRPR